MRYDRFVAPLATVGVMGGLAAESLAGLRVGKRFHNAGGAVRIGGYALLLLLPLGALVLGHPLRSAAAQIEAPPVTLLGVNILAKMGFGAFCGLEYVAIFAGESRSPQRTFARSVYLAAPVIVVMFVAGTAAVLAYVAPADIDLIAPIPQVLALATAGLGPAAHLASAVVVLFALAQVAAGSALLAGITRLPMVAGWDGLLPPWFMRLSPRSRVPVNSILFVSGVVVAFALLGLAGVGRQEAFQMLESASLVFWALTYLVMFAIPIVGRAPGLPRPAAWLRVAAASGFAMTLLFVVLSVFPIVNVKSTVAFGFKMVAVIGLANVLGVGLYVAERIRRSPEA
jgi:amino acid transporter